MQRESGGVDRQPIFSVIKPSDIANLRCYHPSVETEPPCISFLTAQPDHTPSPTPAALHIPDWLKQMPAEVAMMQREEQAGPNGTAKRCLPFVDAMTVGYILPLAADVQFYMPDALNLDIVSPEKLVDWQNERGFPGAPFAQQIVVKFINPWVVQTPPGYSTLFVPMLNQFRFPFQLLSGLVETDTYYNEVYFPAVCLMRPGEVVELKRGTPLVQAIPIKRETFKSNVGEVDAIKLYQYKQELKANVHKYRDDNWQKKTYR